MLASLIDFLLFPVSFIFSLLSIIVFLIIRDRGEYNYRSITILFICGIGIGYLGSYSAMGGILIGWITPLAFYVFYTGFKETLRLEVEKGTPPSIIEKAVILIGLFASSWMFLAIVSSFTFLRLIPSHLLFSQKYWTFLTFSQLIWFIILYVLKIHGTLSPVYKNSRFDEKKYFLLYFGTISALLVFAVNAYFLYSQTAV